MQDSGYRRSVGLFSATMLIAGCMVGSGIFLVSGDVVRMGRTGGFLLGAWVLVALLTAAVALSYGELAAMWPRAGGQYRYFTEIYGPLPGFLYGWTAFTVIETGSIAAVAVGFGNYLGHFYPSVTDEHFLLGPLKVSALHVAGIDIGPYAIGLTPARLAGIAVILLFTLLNTFGVKLASRIQNVFTVAKLAALAALVGLGLILIPHPAPTAGAYVSAEPKVHWLTALLAVQTGTLFSAVGWEYVTNIAAEVKDPERNIPRSLLIGTSMVCGLYLLINIVYLKVLGPTGIATAPGDRVGSATLEALLGPVGGMLMAGAILLSMAGYQNGAILGGSRIYQAMAEDGLFFKQAATLNGAGVPARALGAQMTWACVLALTGTYGQLLDYSIFAALIFYVAAVAGVFVARVRFPDQPRPYRCWGYPFIPAFYVLVGGAILVTLLIVRPAFTWPGLVLVLLGAPVYLLMRPRKG